MTEAVCKAESKAVAEEKRAQAVARQVYEDHACGRISQEQADW